MLAAVSFVVQHSHIQDSGLSKKLQIIKAGELQVKDNLCFTQIKCTEVLYHFALPNEYDTSVTEGILPLGGTHPEGVG